MDLYTGGVMSVVGEEHVPKVLIFKLKGFAHTKLYCEESHSRA